MSVLNDRELTAFAFKEALSRESLMIAKLKTLSRIARDSRVRDLCSRLQAACESRMTMIRREMKKLDIK